MSCGECSTGHGHQTSISTRVAAVQPLGLPGWKRGVEAGGRGPGRGGSGRIEA
ncbi:predicted protein [Streptomyces viridochromogenes DSM 40736]|uniref:Predicted protein n=1 Tax=Streptomyces viridochromogenes (strain DSM 40736 / JCM 4977 / BCRC 1201 / Tue 494) TaxID=591159 RepID=D9XBE4_STRVT|nr:predicted protein [Streptomyces viridochromogenes DSM 40736]